MPTPQRTPIVILRKAELMDLKYLRTQEAQLKKDLKVIEEQVKSREKLYITQLEAGAQVEPGAPRVAVATEEGRRSVPWREAYEGVCGKPAAEALLAAAVPPTIKRLIIED